MNRKVMAVMAMVSMVVVFSPVNAGEENNIRGIPQFFVENTYFVVGSGAMCQDILSTAKLSHALALCGAGNPEGRTEKLLTTTERTEGNLIIVGGPAVNPLATEFGGYFGISYTYRPKVVFEIQCERRTISVDLQKPPGEDICIIYLGKSKTRNVLLVWGYGWQGTYVGAMFMGNPKNWSKYGNAHLLLLRWIDKNKDGLVDAEEIMVEKFS